MKKQIQKLLVVILTVFSYTSQAQTTYIVTNTNNSGPGSLRDIASGVASGDIIRFSPSLLTAGVDSISLLTDIYFDSIGVIIKGLYTATDTLYISGGNISRIFTFNGAGKVVLDSLVLINGNGIGALSYGGGAVLYYEGTDTIYVSNSTFSGNTAHYGGGLFSSATTYSPANNSIIIINNSTFSGNSASYSGGGVYSHAGSCSIKVSNSTFSGNTASTGGGVNSDANYYSSSVEVNNSTFSGNTASDGGGIYSMSFSFSSSSSVAINNSTFSGNIASQDGGGVYSYSSSNISSVKLVSSIFDGSNISNQYTNHIT